MTYGYFEDADRLFARLVVTQALLLPTPPDSLRAAASSLASELRLDLPEGADIVNSGGPQLLSSPTGLMKQASLGESCPACRSEVLLTDLASATCANGHVWRKSIVSPQSPVVPAID